MKRVTILLDDEQLYRDVKAEAARSGRSVKDVVAEALRTWLRGQRRKLTPEERERQLAALRAADELRAQLPRMNERSEDAIREIREERDEEVWRAVSGSPEPERERDAGD